MDYRNSADLSDWNTIIYGHHMKNGSMFASLIEYQDQDYYNKHPVMYLYTPGHRYKLELVAGYTAGVDDMIYEIPVTEDDRDKILEYAGRMTLFDSGVTVDEDDKLVTLSTCSYDYEDARYVVIGKVVEQ
ncbi:MAG: class B sortase [Lachnospiraceae bacterium]|nr:class B sortase [Lachnospiraceae bacterium]